MLVSQLWENCVMCERILFGVYKRSRREIHPNGI